MSRKDLFNICYYFLSISVFNLTLFGPWYVSYGLWCWVMTVLVSCNSIDVSLSSPSSVFTVQWFSPKPSVKTFHNLAHIYSRKVNFHVLIFISFLFLVSLYIFFKKHNSHTKFVWSHTKLVWSHLAWRSDHLLANCTTRLICIYYMAEHLGNMLTKRKYEWYVQSRIKKALQDVILQARYGSFRKYVDQKSDLSSE